jgi:hypothetical protein
MKTFKPTGKRWPQMRELFVSPDYVAFVDDADYEKLAGHKWYAVRHRHGGISTVYAYTRPNGKYGKQVGMHSMLVPHSDHRNHDGLDNQRHNLREATQSQNRMNTRKTVSPTSSQYKGVCWHKKALKWMAYIKINHKMKYLGLFVDEIEAAKAYDEAAKQIFGTFAYLNFQEAL